MTRKRDLEQVQKVADLLHRRDLTALQKAMAQRDLTISRLSAILPPTEMPQASVADALAFQAYRHWIAARRATLNLTLARQTAICLELQQNAVTSTGRMDVVKRLLARR